MSLTQATKHEQIRTYLIVYNRFHYLNNVTYIFQILTDQALCSNKVLYQLRKKKKALTEYW